MNKIISFMILLAGVISFTSCGDDDYTYTAVEPLAVQSTDVLFDANGGEGAIVVGEAGAVTAETTSSWVKLEVSGNTVKVIADVNETLEGRSAKITLKSGSKSADVTATQTGYVLKTAVPESVVFNDNAHTSSYKFSCTFPATVRTTASWLKAELVDGVLTISAEANNDGSIRTGFVVCEARSITQAFEVTQGDIDKDIVGKYFVFGGIDPSAEDPDDAEVAFLTTITKTGTRYTMSFPRLGLSTPVTFNKSNLTMTLAGGQSMGVFGQYNVFSLMYDTESGYYTWNTAATISAPLKQYSINDEDGIFSFVAGEFKDDGKWAGYACRAYCLGAFSSTTASGNGFLGFLAAFTDVVIQEYDMENGAPKKSIGKFASPKKETPLILKNNNYVAAE